VPRTKKPRVRKAPTLREQAEIAQSKAGKESPKRVAKALKLAAKPFKVGGRSLKSAAKPFKKVKLPQNRVTRILAKIGRGIKKVLSKLAPRYFINSWREVRLVVWPDRKETWRLTGAVFVFSLIFGLMVTGVDKVIDSLFKNLVLK
jgi:preprotein translocase SecE subunit